MLNPTSNEVTNEFFKKIFYTSVNLSCSNLAMSWPLNQVFELNVAEADVRLPIHRIDYDPTRVVINKCDELHGSIYKSGFNRTTHIGLY